MSGHHSPQDAMGGRVPADAPIGSGWYVWGRHCTVVEHGVVDGLPAVRLHGNGAPRPDPCMVIAARLVRYGITSEHTELPSRRRDPSASAAAPVAADSPRASNEPRTDNATLPDRPHGATENLKEETMGRNTQKMSARAAAVEVLKKEGGPLPVKVIAERILADYDTGLKGKTPGATIAAQLYAPAKKGILFKKIDRGMIDLIDRDAPVENAEAPADSDSTATAEDDATERAVKPDPKPRKNSRKKKEPVAA